MDDIEDPRARWRELPARIAPEGWLTESDPEPVPGSVQEAQARDTERQRAIDSGG